jgi:hypothetical protein
MKKKLVVLLATMAMLLVAFAAPVVADNDRRDNDRHDNRFDIRFNGDHEDCWWEWSDVFKRYERECD